MKHHILIEFEADTLPPDFTDQIAGRVYGMACVKKGDVVATIVPAPVPPKNFQITIQMNGYAEYLNSFYDIARAQKSAYRL